MAKGVLRLDGISQLADGLRLFAQEVNGGNVSADVFRTVAEDARDDMINHCPVDTGYMRDHIEIEEVTGVGIHIISEAPYSGYVEFGTSRMRAQPFFMPAIERYFKDEFKEMYLRALSDEWAFICRKFSPKGFGSIRAI